MELSNLFDKEFKVILIKMLNELRRRMNEYSENFNNQIENRRKCKTKTITEGFNSRQDEGEEQISKL